MAPELNKPELKAKLRATRVAVEQLQHRVNDALGHNLRAAMHAGRGQRGQRQPGLLRRGITSPDAGRNRDNRLNERMPELAAAGRENPLEVLAADQDAACRLDPREVVETIVDVLEDAAPHARVQLYCA